MRLCVLLVLTGSVCSNADAIVDGVFVEPASASRFSLFSSEPLPQLLPADVQLRLSELLGKLREEQDEPTTTAPVYYVQTQNGNLDAEYLALLDDVGRDGPSFAREVFGGCGSAEYVQVLC